MKFKQLPKLKVISRLGVGMDNINLETAKNMKIKIYKTQTSPSLAVCRAFIRINDRYI